MTLQDSINDLTPSVLKLIEQRDAMRDLLILIRSELDDRRGRGTYTRWMSDYIDAINKLIPLEACCECNGTGTINAFDGKDTGSNTAENWPAPCPYCNDTGTIEADDSTGRTWPAPCAYCDPQPEPTISETSYDRDKRQALAEDAADQRREQR